MAFSTRCWFIMLSVKLKASARKLPQVSDLLTKTYSRLPKSLAVVADPLSNMLMDDSRNTPGSLARSTRRSKKIYHFDFPVLNQASSLTASSLFVSRAVWIYWSKVLRICCRALKCVRSSCIRPRSPRTRPRKLRPERESHNLIGYLGTLLSLQY